MRLVERQIKSDPSFKPPAEYLMAKRQNSGRPTDKVYIPVKEFPEINFFGLLVGPRGNSLKTMERESGAKISIRGKGSVKEGKGRPGGPAEDENDELHCLITADTEEKVQRCVKLINSVIETVSTELRAFPFPSLTSPRSFRRPPPFPRVRTTTSATSFVSSPRSTVPSVTTRTRSASTSRYLRLLCERLLISLHSQELWRYRTSQV